MRNILLIILLLLFYSSIGQLDTVFFDKDWNRANRQDSVAFYGFKDYDKSQEGLATYYYSTGELHSYQNEKVNLKHGECKWFYKNGFPKAEGLYEDDVPYGKFTYYLESDSGKVRYYSEYKNGDEKCSYSIEDDGTIIYTVLDKSPEFNGGLNKMYDYLGKNILYPMDAYKDNISGKVYIQFVVTEKGEVTDVWVVKGAHELLDAEAKRVIESMPKWKPGKHNGEKVKCRYTIPINFTIG